MTNELPIDPARCWGGVHPILGPKLPSVAKRLETAIAALDPDRVSNGRFVLGLGASTRWVTRSHFGVDGPKPVLQLRECVAAVRHIVAHAHTGLTPFEGEYFRADFEGLEPADGASRTSIDASI